ncbi:MAG: restriction endonuclease subunit S [Clostridia bacterium]|nr:restriction endonuclease subunit S [Clostridia bacterium]
MYEIADNLISNDFKVNLKKDSFNNVIRFLKGKKPKRISDFEEKEFIRYLTISCLNNQEELYASPLKTVISSNDILMVMDGASSGDVYYSTYGIVGSTLAKVEIINIDYTKEYVFFVLKKYSGVIKNKVTGSAIPHTDKAFINTLMIPNISIEQQFKYKRILEKIQHNILENINLIKIRDTLLPKLMNGEIDLDKIEI